MLIFFSAVIYLLLSPISAKHIVFCNVFANRSHINHIALFLSTIPENTGHKLTYIGADASMKFMKDYDMFDKISLGDLPVKEDEIAPKLWKDGVAVEPPIAELMEIFLSGPYTSYYDGIYKHLERMKPDLVVANGGALECLEASQNLNIPFATSSPTFAPYLVTYPEWMSSLMHKEAGVTNAETSLLSRAWHKVLVVTEFMPAIKVFVRTLIYRYSNGLSPFPPIGIPAEAAAAFVNTYPILDLNVPMQPHEAQIGPVISDLARIKPASDDLIKFLDSKKKVAYLALGSHVKIDDAKRTGLIKLFNALLEDGSLDGVVWIIKKDDPSLYNVDRSKIYLETWTSQLYVLKHPSVKLFISHGGSDSVAEATAVGKPLFCLANFADQPMNGKKLTRLGVAFWHPAKTFTSASLTTVLPQFRHLLNSPEPTEAAQRLGKVAKAYMAASHVKAHAMIEAVLQFGPKALRNEAERMSWFQRTGWDATLLVGVFMLVSHIVPMLLLKQLWPEGYKKMTMPLVFVKNLALGRITSRMSKAKTA